MTYSELAKKLRQRQLKMKLVSAELIKAVSNVDIIESYFECAKCRKNVFTEEAQRNLITASQSVDEFVERISLALKWHSRIAHSKN